jgi:hypothetical protein
MLSPQYIDEHIANLVLAKRSIAGARGTASE